MNEQEFLKNIGGNISAIRKKRGMTQTQLGYLCDMEKSNIIRIEKGRTNPTTLTLLKLSIALKVDVKDLF